MNINIDINLSEFLTKKSNEAGNTPEVWVQDFLNSSLKTLWKEDISKTISTQKIEDVKTFETAISTIAEEIKIRDYVVSVEISEPIISIDEPIIIETDATSTPEIIK